MLTKYNQGFAALLSLLAPGIGQVYTGRWFMAIFFLIFTPGFWIGTGGTLGWIFHVWAAWHAWKAGK